MNDDEDRLKRSFTALRRHDERGAPPFQVPRGPALPIRPESSRGKVIALYAAPIAAIAVAAAAMLFVTSTERNAPPSAGAPAAAQLEAREDLAPLDFLLDVPAGSVISNRPVLEAPELTEVKR